MEMLKANALNNLRGEILNDGGYPITDGFVDGKDNCRKTVKRSAYGYHNGGNVRKRILSTTPACEVKVSHSVTYNRQGIAL